jgi:transposase
MELAATSEIISSVPTGTEEDSVITQNQWCLVRALAERGLNRSAIARELGLDLKTVRKYLTHAWEPQRRQRRHALDQFAAFLRGRAPEVGFNAAVLWRELGGLGYRGSYPSVVRYLHPWRAALDQTDPTPRFETDPGAQAQVDWGSAAVWLGADRQRVHLFIMVLGYSRRIYVKAYPNERLEALLDGHASAFAHFGGRTRTILYDNPRTIVLEKDEAGGEVNWNRTFKDRMDFYGVEIRLCRYYRARTKGKVESGVKYVKRNALAGRRFHHLEHLNEWLLEWCLGVADRRLHGTTHEPPADRFARAEAAALLAVDGRETPAREWVAPRVVTRDTYVVVETNRYPVPVAWVGQQVEVRLRAEEVIITHGVEGAINYPRLAGKHGVARWRGEPRTWARLELETGGGPPRFDPAYYAAIGEVELRPLESYAALCGEVRG